MRTDRQQPKPVEELSAVHRRRRGTDKWEERIKHPLSHHGKYDYGNTVIGAMKMFVLIDSRGLKTWETWTFASRALAISCNVFRERIKNGKKEANFIRYSDEGVYLPDVVREGRWCVYNDIAAFFGVSRRTVHRWENDKGYLETEYRPFRNQVCAPIENIIDILWWRKTRRILNKRTAPYSIEDAKLLYNFSNEAICDLGRILS